MGISPPVNSDSHRDAEAHRRGCKCIAAVSVSIRNLRALKDLYPATLPDDVAARLCVKFVTTRAHLAEKEHQSSNLIFRTTKDNTLVHRNAFDTVLAGGNIPSMIDQALWFPRSESQPLENPHFHGTLPELVLSALQVGRLWKSH